LYSFSADRTALDAAQCAHNHKPQRTEAQACHSGVRSCSLHATHTSDPCLVTLATHREIHYTLALLGSSSPLPYSPDSAHLNAHAACCCAVAHAAVGVVRKFSCKTLFLYTCASERTGLEQLAATVGNTLTTVSTQLAGPHSCHLPQIMYNATVCRATCTHTWLVGMKLLLRGHTDRTPIFAATRSLMLPPWLCHRCVPAASHATHDGEAHYHGVAARSSSLLATSARPRSRRHGTAAQ